MKSFCGLAKTEESLIHSIKEIFWLNPQYNDVSLPIGWILTQQRAFRKYFTLRGNQYSIVEEF